MQRNSSSLIAQACFANICELAHKHSRLDRSRHVSLATIVPDVVAESATVEERIRNAASTAPEGVAQGPEHEAAVLVGAASGETPK